MKKKNKHVDINSKVFSLKLMGLMAAFALTLVSFQWKQFEFKQALAFEGEALNDEDEIVPNSDQVKPPPPPPLKVEKLQSVVLKIIKDEKIDQQTTNLNILDVPPPPPPPPLVEDNKIHMTASVQPKFPGGYEKFVEYLQENIVYPPIAVETNTSGKVYVEFVVMKDGSMADIKVKRGIGAGCDEEAIRVLKQVPRWVPGEQLGKPVNVYYTVPVAFRLMN